uniref:Uncharacterized protein n=1 Tax=Oryza meridionalis TaxID=40149 RepID=A0A0E0EEU1_9ORYZ
MEGRPQVVVVGDGGIRSMPLMAGSDIPAGVQAEVVGVRTEEAGGARGEGRRHVGRPRRRWPSAR